MIELAAGFLVGLLVGNIKRAGRDIDRDAAYIALLSRQQELRDAARDLIEEWEAPSGSSAGMEMAFRRLRRALNEQRGEL